MEYTILRHEAEFDIARSLNGRLGLVKDSRPVTEFKYDEITLWPPEYDVFYCREGRDYEWIGAYDGKDYGYGRSGGYDNVVETDGFIERCVNGMFGIEHKGVQVLPFEFDEAFKWHDCDVLYTRKGSDCAYFDTTGKRILTTVREIPGAEDILEPYYDGEPQTNIIQLMDLSDNPQGDDYCQCYGRRAGLSRRTIPEHMALVKRLSTHTALSDSDFAKNLLAEDCYIFSAHMVQSDGDVVGALDEGIRQLEEKKLFKSSWNLVWNIILPKGQISPLAEEYAKREKVSPDMIAILRQHGCTETGVEIHARQRRDILSRFNRS